MSTRMTNEWLLTCTLTGRKTDSDDFGEGILGCLSSIDMALEIMDLRYPPQQLLQFRRRQREMLRWLIESFPYIS